MIITSAIALILILSIFSSHLRVNIDSKRKLFLVLKPITIISIIVLAFAIDSNPESRFSFYIKSALIISFVGDVFLMLKESKFKYGLIAFLVAHIAYSFAFIQGVFAFNFYLLISAILFSSIMLVILGNSIGKYRLVVLLYVGVLTVMFWVGINRYLFMRDQASMLISIGAILFVISDSFLAYKKFRNNNPKYEYIILNSYFIAQLLFALSLK
ncbi:MAG: lysoplasmalogenase [Melioribacteraceae bacterium]|nr:lysoplasmalogenase [Melioribacteraceae bacterium]